MIFNFDACFFEIEAPDSPSLTDAIAGQDILSLTITEELGTLDSGNLVLNDCHNLYSRFFRPGTRIDVGFGIKIFGQEIKRPKMQFMICSPGGNGASNGDITYNCSLTATYRGDVHKKPYTARTKKDVVEEVMTSLGVGTRYIAFKNGQDQVTPTTEIIQNESDFRFLVRKADEWGCLFRIGYDKTGTLVGMFVDYDKTSKAAQAISGRSSLFLEYGYSGKITDLDSDRINPIYLLNGGGGPNVIDYTWKDTAMNSATGDGVTITLMPDGTAQATRYSVPDEQVKTYRLIP